jgi:hypothetical protein
MKLTTHKQDTHPRGKPTLFLHIGTPKTGTTAIQHFGIDNQTALHKKGVFYFPTDYINTWYGKGHHYTNDIIQNNNAIQLIFDSNCHAAIISSEGMTDFTDLEIKSFTSFFSDFDLKVIVYLRRQDHVFHSLYNQYVKWRFFCRVSCDDLVDVLDCQSIDTVCQYFNVSDDATLAESVLKSYDFLDYNILLSRWEQYVGKTNLIVRIFEKQKLHRHDIVSDFFSLIGLDIAPPNIEFNNSLSDPFLEFMYKLNSWGNDKLISRTYREEIAAAVWKIDAEIAKPKRKTSNRLSNENRRRIIQRYSDSNNLIGTQYFGARNQSPFNTVLPTDPSFKFSLDDQEVLSAAFQIIQTILTEYEVNKQDLITRYEESSSWKLTRSFRQLSKFLKK